MAVKLIREGEATGQVPVASPIIPQAEILIPPPLPPIISRERQEATDIKRAVTNVLPGLEDLPPTKNGTDELPFIPDDEPAADDWRADEAQDKNSKRDTDQSRRFDRTQLKAASYGYSVHRDYAAHFFRWGFAKRFVKSGAHVLDVGCGQDQPLARVLASGAGGNVPSVMYAVDYNPITKPFKARWLTTKDKFDFTGNYQDVAPADLEFDVVTCFEVIEHMHTVDARKLLAGLYYWVKADGMVLLSTPVFNGRAAANHIHEYTIAELQEFVEAAGFRVQKRYGTFASYTDLKREASPEHVQLIDRMREFYDNDVAACFLAPLYPDLSRNNVWLLRPVVST